MESARLEMELARLETESAQLEMELTRLEMEPIRLEMKYARLEMESACLERELAHLPTEPANIFGKPGNVGGTQRTARTAADSEKPGCRPSSLRGPTGHSSSAQGIALGSGPHRLTACRNLKAALLLEPRTTLRRKR